MENLKIINFLIIRKADFDIGKLNLIIGPQASGKSIIAKLLYFFRKFIDGTYLGSIQNLETKRQLEKKGIADFELFFPRYTWNDQEFKIIYRINDFEISIIRGKDKRGNLSIKLDYSKNLILLHQELTSAYKKKRAKYYEENKTKFQTERSDPFSEVITEYIFNSEYGESFKRSIFIPASRSFFANLQKNIFSFLASKIDIDLFIKDFGADYEIAKQIYEWPFILFDQNDKVLSDKIRHLVESVLVGKYKYEDGQDWIEQKNKKINLANASSGQQEALPMLLMLSVWTFSATEKRKCNFFIEEPEAHLFPVSQKHIMSLIGLIYNKKSHNFVITTHSPYILTAINNMILTSTVAKEKNVEEMEPVIDTDYSINYEDVRAFTIRDGVLENILDEETRLIGTSIIDSVSDDFDKVFDRLIGLQIGE